MDKQKVKKLLKDLFLISGALTVPFLYFMNRNKLVTYEDKIYYTLFGYRTNKPDLDIQKVLKAEEEALKAENEKLL